MSDEAKGGADLTPQEQYDQAWRELEAQEQGGKKPEDKKAEGTTEAAAPEKKPDEKPDQKPGETSKTHGSIESLEKALNDTKTYANQLKAKADKLETEVEELRKLKESGATQKEIKDQQRAVAAAKDNLDDIKKKVYEDYPELEPLVDTLIERNRNLEQELDSVKKDRKADAEKTEKQKALEAFERDVMPSVLKEHPDFRTIIADENYWTWAEKQRPSLRVAASESNDPADINWALTEYKRSIHAGDIDKLKEQQDSERKKKISDAQTLRGGSAGPPNRGSSKKDPNDYAGGFDEAGALLEKEGIRA